MGDLPGQASSHATDSLSWPNRKTRLSEPTGFSWEAIAAGFACLEQMQQLIRHQGLCRRFHLIPPYHSRSENKGGPSSFLFVVAMQLLLLVRHLLLLVRHLFHQLGENMAPTLHHKRPHVPRSRRHDTVAQQRPSSQAMTSRTWGRAISRNKQEWATQRLQRCDPVLSCDLTSWSCISQKNLIPANDHKLFMSYMLILSVPEDVKASPVPIVSDWLSSRQLAV